MTDIIDKKNTNTLNAQMRQGFFWNAINLIINRGTSILVRLLLARFLAPEDFGLIVMTIVFLGLIDIFVDFGLKNALIQRKYDTDTSLHFDSVFWFLLVTGACWTLLFILAGAPLMAWFYGDPQLNTLATVMGVSIILNCLPIVPEALLTRHMRFKSIVIAEATGTIIASIVAISMVYAGAGFWALAAQQLVAATLRTTLLWYFAKWRPRWRFNWQSLRNLFGFSGWMFGSQIIYFIRTNLDNVLIGFLLGATSLGVYTLAYMVTENVRSQLAKIITSVMLPVYSRMQSTPNEIKPHYLAVTRAMTLLLFPFLLSVIIYTNDIVTFLFTGTWQNAILPIKILAIGGMAYATSGPSAEVLQGLGETQSLFKISTLNLCFLGIPSIWLLTLYFGLPGAASAMLVTFIGMRVLSYIMLKKFLDIKILDITSAAGPALIVMLFIMIIEITVIKGRAIPGVPLIILAYLFVTVVNYHCKIRNIFLKIKPLQARSA